jgi:hypothetical protein
MNHPFEQAFAEYRKTIPQAKSEDLLKCFEEIHWCLAQLAMAAELVGLHYDPAIEQQYRLTVYAVEQELFRRLHVSS